MNSLSPAMLLTFGCWKAFGRGWEQQALHLLGRCFIIEDIHDSNQEPILERYFYKYFYILLRMYSRQA
jgi:hypothetical protein